MSNNSEDPEYKKDNSLVSISMSADERSGEANSQNAPKLDPIAETTSTIGKI